MSLLSDSSSIVAIVPARNGSKGLVGKNTLPLHGVPLYLRAVQQGLRVVDRVLLTTDIEAIDGSELPAGCVLCRRPAELAGDYVPMAAVIRQLIEKYSLAHKTILLLQPTSPLRLDSDIESALELFASQQHSIVLSVVERDKAVLKYGTVHGARFTAMRMQNYCFSNRQQLPPVYGPNGAVFVFDANRFIDEGGFPCDNIGVVKMPMERSVDIDTLADFHQIERLMQKRLRTE